MTIREQKTYKLFIKLNAYTDIVKANYNFYQLESWDRYRVANLRETAWTLNKLKPYKPKIK